MKAHDEAPITENKAARLPFMCAETLHLSVVTPCYSDASTGKKAQDIAVSKLVRFASESSEQTPSCQTINQPINWCQCAIASKLELYRGSSGTFCGNKGGIVVHGRSKM